MKRAAPRPPGWRTFDSLSAVERDKLVGEWVFRQDTAGCWRGWHEDGRKTPLKATLRAAQEDSLNERFVCGRWPHCHHYDVDTCCAQARIMRDTEPARQEQWR
jgi:hypothetical protein